MLAPAHSAAAPVVSSFTEWEPLEEVVVGVIDGAAVPEWHVALRATMPVEGWNFFQINGGRRFDEGLVDAARRELEGFVCRLEREGVAVRRPDRVDFTRPYATPER